MKKLLRIAPQKLKRAHKPFDHPDWVFELKHDGYRSVVYISTTECRLVSRNANAFKRFNVLANALAKLPVSDAILDGEIVCLDSKGHSLFNELFHRKKNPYFYAFDLLWLDGKDLRSLPLIKRKERLRRLGNRSKNPALLFADHVDEFGCDFFRMICEKHLEGIVAKHREHRYDSSAKWIKIKNSAYTQTEGRHELFNKSEL